MKALLEYIDSKIREARRQLRILEAARRKLKEEGRTYRR